MYSSDTPHVFLVKYDAPRILTIFLDVLGKHLLDTGQALVLDVSGERNDSAYIRVLWAHLMALHMSRRLGCFLRYAYSRFLLPCWLFSHFSLFSCSCIFLCLTWYWLTGHSNRHFCRDSQRKLSYSPLYAIQCSSVYATSFVLLVYISLIGFLMNHIGIATPGIAKDQVQLQLEIISTWQVRSNLKHMYMRPEKLQCRYQQSYR